MNVRPAPPAHFPWLKSRSFCTLTEDFRAVEALDESDQRPCPRCGLWHGKVRGMVGYAGWTPSSVSMHVALETPGATKALLGPAFEYPFIQEGRSLVLAVVASTNEASLKLVRHLGFRHTYTVRGGWTADVDMVLHEMRRDEWERWRKERRHGRRRQEQQSSER